MYRIIIVIIIGRKSYNSSGGTSPAGRRRRRRMVHALNAAAAATDDDEVSARAADTAAEHARRPLSVRDQVGWLAVIWRPVFDTHCRCPCLSCVRRARVYIIITLIIIICAPHHHRCRPIASNNHSNYFSDNKTVPIFVIRRRRVSALCPAPLGPERSRTTGSSVTESRR